MAIGVSCLKNTFEIPGVVVLACLPVSFGNLVDFDRSELALSAVDYLYYLMVFEELVGF